MRYKEIKEWFSSDVHMGYSVGVTRFWFISYNSLLSPEFSGENSLAVKLSTEEFSARIARRTDRIKEICKAIDETANVDFNKVVFIFKSRTPEELIRKLKEVAPHLVVKIG